MKDKRQRALALQEILENKDSNGADVMVVEDASPHPRAKSNGIRGDVIDITDGTSNDIVIDAASNDSNDTRSSVPQKIPVLVPGPPPMPTVMMQPQPQQHQSISTIITTAQASSASVIMNKNLLVLQHQHQQLVNRAMVAAAMSAPPPGPPPLPTQSATNAATADVKKPKSLTTLPLPPGINVQELANAKTPSPPHSPRTATTDKTGKPAASHKDAAAKSKKSLLNLPMPQMGVGAPEEGSGDEDFDGKTKASGTNGGRMSTPGKKKIHKRPVILNRRNSRSVVGPGPGGLDWGERCVDVFEVLVQIGEGTYGQVSPSPPLSPH